MLLTEKKVKCPLCGAKNPPDAPRCATCTRPLQNDPLPSQAVYQEALWSNKIASKASRKKSNPYAILALVVIAALALNYFVVGLGPDWLHQPEDAVRGETWKEYRHAGDYVADLPGTPMESTATAGGTQISTSTVWVDSGWNVIRDDTTQSVAALDAAQTGVHALVVTAVGPAPSDPVTALPLILQSFADGLQLEPTGVATLQDPTFGQQFAMETSFTGFPEPAKGGTARAKAYVVDGKIYLAATLVVGGGDSALQQHLVELFRPTGMPEDE